MNPQDGPILIVDDDEEDLELIKDAFISINVQNEIICMESGPELLSYLRATRKQPLFILCDVNMPLMNGFLLREEINKDKSLLLKSIPFLFLSTSANKEEVSRAYKLTVQGYLKKPTSFTQFQEVLKDTVAYWRHCIHPNSF